MTQAGIESYYSAEVVDESGDRIGQVGQVYLDDETGQPSWATVKTGWFGTKETFVPLQAGSLEGNRLRVPYSKDHVKNAPSVDPDQHITEEEEAELYRYYNLGGTTSGYDSTGTDVGYDRDATTGTTQVGSDDELVRREERLRVGTERSERGRARLRKYVVTETQQVDVPVSREELRVERVPLDGTEDVGGGVGVGQGDDVQEIVLNEERPVIGKETVGVEKIRVGKETVTDTETVTSDVAKEQVEIDESGTTRTNDR